MKKFGTVLLVLLVLCTACTTNQPTESLSVDNAENSAARAVKTEGLAPRGAAQTPDTSAIVKKYLDIAYGQESQTQTLDLYLPNEGDGPFPLIIEIHGGGFFIGSKSESQLKPMLEGLNRGYAVASINYRLSKEATYPAAINDVKAAIRFLRSHAQEYSLNPDAFAVWGGSAGGHLAALAAVSADEPVFQADPEISDRVQAAVDWFGPIYFSTMDAQFEELGTSGIMGLTNAPTSAESQYLGYTIGTPEAQKLVEETSPLNYISSDDPPMLIQHGSADRNIPYLQSIELSEALAQAIGNDKVEFELIENASHGGAEFETAENVDKVFTFLDTFLK